MSENPFDDPKFHRLRNEWYNKLKDEGFYDIEFTGPKGSVARFFRKSLGSVRQNYDINVETYYQIVANFATHYPFDSNLDREIMQKHAEGMPYRSISKYLKREYGTKEMKACAATICNRMKTLKQIMFEWDRTNPEGLSYTRELFEGYKDYGEANDRIEEE